MEFEKNRPTTKQDQDLADAPHVTLQPVHANLAAEEATINTAHKNDPNFEFETELTAPAALSSTAPSGHPHHRTAIILSVVIATTFAIVLLALYSLR